MSGGGSRGSGMDRGNGWRVNPCASSIKDRTIINRIMLRFRPIAPKPVDGDSSSGNLKPENKNGLINKERKKRKYVRVKKKKNNNNERYPNTSKKKVVSISSSDQETQREEDHGTKLALQLLPGQEKIGSEVLIKEERSCDGVDDVAILGEEKKDQESLSTTLNFNNHLIHDMGGLIMSDLKDRRRRRIVETQVTVESVTDTCMDLELLGSTDVEKLRNLEKDTCPWFISDGSNEVRWVNEAFKKMVIVDRDDDDDGQPLEITVGLVIQEKFLAYLYCSAFTCWVRLKYTWQKEKFSQMVPCDVWKMDFGGFAWRLDVKAALSLGLKQLAAVS